VTEPRSDKAVWVGSAFFEKFITAPARAQNKLAACFAGSDAVKDNVWAVMRKEKGLIITGVGHGNEDVFTGDGMREIFRTCTVPDDVIRGQHVTHLSCTTGARLGPDLVNKGAIHFSGYKDTYWFMYNDAPDPTKDTYAVDFMEPDMLKEAYEIDGVSAKDAFNNAMIEYDKRAAKWDKINAEVARFIRWDRSIAVFIEEETPPEPPVEDWICRLLKWLMEALKCEGA